MFIAMNRFQIVPGSEPAFEEVWRARDSRLADVPGFVEFRIRPGATAMHSRPGPGPTISAKPMPMQATAKACIWGGLSSKVSTPFSRVSGWISHAVFPYCRRSLSPRPDLSIWQNLVFSAFTGKTTISLCDGVKWNFISGEPMIRHCPKTRPATSGAARSRRSMRNTALPGFPASARSKCGPGT